MLLDLMNALFSDMITIIILTSIMVMMTTTIVVIIMTMIHIILIYQQPSHLTNVHVGVFCITTWIRLRRNPSPSAEVQGWDATQTVNMHGTGGMPIGCIFWAEIT